MYFYDGDYFKKMRMDSTEVDPDLYSAWSSWCFDSEDRYFIDGEMVDGKLFYFTHERTDEEIAWLHKAQEVRDYLGSLELDEEVEVNKAYIMYVDLYLGSELTPEEDLLTYEQFVEEYNKKH